MEQKYIIVRTLFVLAVIVVAYSYLTGTITLEITLTLVFGIATLVLLSFQTLLLDQQKEISCKQTEILEYQHMPIVVPVRVETTDENSTFCLLNVGQHPAFNVKVKVCYGKIEKDANIISRIDAREGEKSTKVFFEGSPPPKDLDLTVTIQSESYFGKKVETSFIRPTVQ